MRKTFILALLFLLSFNAFASHLMGGDITASWIGSGPNDLTYQITLSLYRDVNGISLTNPETMTLTDLNGNFLPTNITISKNSSLSTSMIPFFPYGVEAGIYTTVITLPGQSNWRLEYYSCCRNAAILNATNPGSDGMVLYTDIKPVLTAGINNSSPECMAMPIAYFPINLSATYNPLPYDVNGDSLSWSLDTPISALTNLQVVAGFSKPSSAASGPFSMNPVTGEITWTPNALGNYIQSFNINEYNYSTKLHTGTIVRDMQYIIVADTTIDTLSLVPISAYNNNSSPAYKYVYYTPGQQLSFNVNGLCGNPIKSLSLNAFGSIFSMSNPATFTTTGTFSNVPGTLHWTPPTGFSKDVIIVFRLHGGMFSKDFTLLLRNNPNPGKVANTKENNCILNVYPNPVQNVLNLSLDLEKDINSNISVYSVLGQKVANFHTGNLSTGHHLLHGDINFAPGVYYLVIKDEGILIKTQCIIVQ